MAVPDSIVSRGLSANADLHNPFKQWVGVITMAFTHAKEVRFHRVNRRSRQRLIDEIGEQLSISQPNEARGSGHKYG